MKTVKKLAAGVTFAAALVAGAALSSGAQAATISNGSFETGPAVPSSPGFVTLLGGDTSISGWRVIGNSIDYIESYWQPQDGQHSLDLNGVGQGGIQTTITGLIPFQSYVVSFWIAGNPDGAPTTKSGFVSATTGSYSFTFDASTSTHSSMGWLLQSFVFTALDPSGNQLLSFSSLDPGSYGVALDNVSIAQTPLPGALMLMGSVLMGGAGLARWRKRGGRLPAAA